MPWCRELHRILSISWKRRLLLEPWVSSVRGRKCQISTPGSLRWVPLDKFSLPLSCTKQCQTEENPVYIQSTSWIFGLYIEKTDLCLLNTGSGGRFVWHTNPHTHLQVKTQAVHPEFTADNAVATAFDRYEQAAIRDTLYSSSFSLGLLPVFQEFQICWGGKTGRDSQWLWLGCPSGNSQVLLASEGGSESSVCVIPISSAYDTAPALMCLFLARQFLSWNIMYLNCTS